MKEEKPMADVARKWPAIGSVWIDNDPRSWGRKVRIVDSIPPTPSHPKPRVLVRTIPNGRETKIRTEMFGSKSRKGFTFCYWAPTK